MAWRVLRLSVPRRIRWWERKLFMRAISRVLRKLRCRPWDRACIVRDDGWKRQLRRLSDALSGRPVHAPPANAPASADNADYGADDDEASNVFEFVLEREIDLLECGIMLSSVAQSHRQPSANCDVIRVPLQAP